METEANATFKMNDYQKNTYEYALAYIDAIMETLQVNGDPENWADKGSLTDDAHEAGRKPYGTPYAAATSLKGETLVCVVGVGAGLTPGGKLGDEHWHCDKGYTYYIYQYERRTAVLAGLTRETPYIAKAYRTARGGEDGSHT